MYYTYVCIIRLSYLSYMVFIQLERAMVEICDAVYDEYAKLMALPEDSETGLCFKTYTLVRVDSA